MLSEAKITQRIASFLRRKQWEILAIHYPGSQAGLSLRCGSREEVFKRRRVIPDFIAKKNNLVLIGESKVVWSDKDARKLRSLKSDTLFKRDLVIKALLDFDCLNDYVIQPAIACSIMDQQKTIDFPDLVIFKVLSNRTFIFNQATMPD